MKNDSMERTMSGKGNASAGVQDARGYLRDVRAAFKRAEVLCERAQHYRRLAIQAACRGKDDMYVQRMMETHDELKRTSVCLLQKLREAEKRIALLQNDRYRVVLQLRYLCALDWETVAQRMNCQLRWVHRLHSRAVARLEDVLAHGDPKH